MIRLEPVKGKPAWVRALLEKQASLLRPDPVQAGGGPQDEDGDDSTLSMTSFSNSEERIETLARLESLGPDLTKTVCQKLPCPILLRIDLLEALIGLLGQGHSPLLVGEPGVGRRTLVWQLAYAIAQDLPDFPQRLARRPLYLVPADRFQFGVFYMHELETKVRLVVTAALRNRAILAIHDAHMLVRAGANESEDPRTVANLLRPAMDQGLQILGLTTPDGYRFMNRVNPDFTRQFVCLDVPPLSPEATRRVLRARLSESPEAIDEVIDQTLEVTAWLGEPLPGGPLRLVEEARAVQTRSAGLRRADLYEAVHRRTGLPLALVSPDEALPPEAVRAFFAERVYGQPEAVEALVDVILRVKARMVDPDRPWAVLLFVGPSGVGKTELARQAAAFLFGSEERLVRCDMGSLVGAEGLARFLRTAVEEVASRPCAVVLFDEIEKTDAYLTDALLSVLGEARVTDVRGRTVSFRNCLIVLTSNVGSELYGYRRPSLVPDLPTLTLSRMIRRRLEERFRPEFLGRIDRIVVFRQLTREVVRQIAQREVQRIEAQLRRRWPGLSLAIGEDLLDRCIAEGWDPIYGARPLKQSVERWVAAPLSRFLGAHPGIHWGTLRLEVGPDGKVVVCQGLSSPNP